MIKISRISSPLKDKIKNIETCSQLDGDGVFEGKYTTSGTIGTSITYKGGLAAESGSAYLNRCEGDYSSASNQVPGSYTQSSITVMEIQQ